MKRAEVQVEAVAVSERSLAGYAAVPIAFEVHEVLRVGPDDVRRAFGSLKVERVAEPYVKDYDALPGAGPGDWLGRFDVGNWGMLVARRDGEWVGGAVVAVDTDGLEMLGGRRDLAVLWDLRVAPAVRGRGVGRVLFRAAAAWAAERGCIELDVETQDINVPACRLYAGEGCGLVSVEPNAYADCPGETRLIWRIALDRSLRKAPNKGR
ncbi:MAG: GNAT family N-acetyltransferase [Planctomycetota bacterium]